MAASVTAEALPEAEMYVESTENRLMAAELDRQAVGRQNSIRCVDVETRSGVLPETVVDEQPQDTVAAREDRPADGDLLTQPGSDDVAASTPAHTDFVALPAADPALLQALEQALGGGPLTVDRILEWSTLAERGRRAASSRDAIASHLNAYETRVAELEADRAELRQQVQDSQLEIAVAENEHARAAVEVRACRNCSSSPTKPPKSGSPTKPPNKHSDNDPRTAKTSQASSARGSTSSSPATSTSSSTSTSTTTLAGGQAISPRLHYYNDVRGTGRIYIGKHLRNSQTN